ncbi:hypothetical protein [Aliiglaciecola sp. LCG003]|uniref:hypothetical protein n=1 Tax=Aliiglaciecola sp. LCG003 TaxID=3053655 RepID=UPI002574287E|nr:hypothetical protein [Aliiglaciecola sp. LCG003]WJG09844.1 hypothetical protein QR722_02070 [Aliiglaciecola sp. LCG003]
MDSLRHILRKTSLLVILVGISVGHLQAKEDNQSDSIERVEVVGEKTLAFYRTQMEAAEVEFYDEFNKHVKNSRYKVVCKDEPRDNSYRITQKACYPMYFLEKKTDMINRARQSRSAIPSNKDVEASLRSEKAKAMKHAEKLVQKKPELKTKLVEMYKTKQLFLKAEQQANNN